MKQVIIFIFLLFFIGCAEKEETPLVENTSEINTAIEVNEIIENKIDQNITVDINSSTISEETEIIVSTQVDINDTEVFLEPYYYQQWYLEKDEAFYLQNAIDNDAHIHANNLLHTYRGAGVKIAVIDDGLDVTHEDLNGSVIHTYDISTGTTNVAHLNQSGHHGTAVTGIIGARSNSLGIQGVASSSQIIFIKHNENMSDSETIELFTKAEEFGADIINCSWGTYDVSQAVTEKIQDLAINGRDSKGIIIVFAVGNDDRDMGNDESAIPEVLAVSASDKDNLRAWYSNYGEHLDVVAPGGYELGITTLDNMGNNGIASLDENYLLYDDHNSFIGTSASAPIVSGVIALMLERNPNLTRVEIEDILKNSSDKIGNLAYKNGRNNYYGYGKINLSSIMNYLSME